MLSTFISKVFIGAVVGYTTNDMAIQMLFRKRFGLGGIFLKTTDEFILNISQVVERDILNHRTLHDQLNSQGFEAEIEKTVRRYLEEQLYQSIPTDFRLGQVPGIEQSVAQLLATFRAALPAAIEPLMGRLIRDLHMGDILSPPQLAQLSSFVTGLLLQKLDETDFVQRFVRQLYEELQNQTPADVLTPDLVEEIGLHVAYVSDVLHQSLLQNHTQDLDVLLEALYDQLHIPDQIREIAQRIGAQQFEQILGRTTIEAILGQLLNDTRQIIRSERGEAMLSDFSDLIIETLAAEEKTIFDLLSSDIQQNIRTFFKEQFPPILDRIIDWLYSKQDTLETLIDESFGRNVDNRFKVWLVETFIGSVSQSANIVERLVDIIRNYRQNPERIARQITQQIIGYLSEQSIGTIVSNLRDQRVLVRLSTLLQKNVGDALERLEVKHFEPLFQKKLVDFFPLDQVVHLVDQNIRLLIERQLKERFLYSRRAALLLASSLQNRLWQVSNRGIGTGITPNQVQIWSSQLDTWVLDLGQHQRPMMEELLREQVGKPLMVRPWSSIVSVDQISNFGSFVIEGVEGYLQRGFDKRKNNQIHTYVRVLNRIPDLHARLGEILRVALLENLEPILQGRIQTLVQSNLHRQSTAQIRDMVEKFMGQELKPITRLGALFGGMAGGALFYLPNFQNVVAKWGIPAIAYGLTGLGTNWIALRMIFRPYTRKYLPLGRRKKLPLPLTPGVVVRRQAKFANKMGDFVSDKLMNAEGLQDSFGDKKEEIREMLVRLIQKDDYALVEQFVHRHKEPLADKVVDTSFRFLQENKDKIKQRLQQAVDRFQDHTLAGADTAFLEEQLLQYLRRPQTLEYLHQQLMRYWATWKQVPESLHELLPDEVQDRFVQFLSRYLQQEGQELIKQFDDPIFIQAILDDINQQIARYGNNSLNSILRPEQAQNIQQQFAQYIYQEINHPRLKAQLLQLVMERVNTELTPQKTIGDLFGGELLRFIERNLDFIIQKIFESAIVWMKNNSELLADRIYERAFTEQKAALLYKDTIRKTVLELINEGVPAFITQENTSIRSLIGEEINRLGTFKIEIFNIRFEEDYLRVVIDQLIGHPRSKESVQQLTVALLRETFSLPLRELLPLDNLSEISDFQNFIREEIRNGGHALGRSLSQSDLSKSIETFLHTVIGDVLKQISPQLLLEDFSSVRVSESLQKVLHLLAHCEAFQTQVRQLVFRILEVIKGQPLGVLLSVPLLQNDLGVLLDRLLDEEDKNGQLRASLRVLILQNIAALPQNISLETKDYLAQTLAQSALDALGHRLPDLLGSVDIHTIVVEELNRMSPENLEFLFKGFAKKYLDELVRYGFGFGLVFGMGLDALLSFLLDNFKK
ncbi:MAG: DUF445 family protein [Bernardetiaceae bacterium]